MGDVTDSFPQITAFINNYSTALSTAKTFDAKVVSDATKISSTYASLVELSIRQAIGAIEITISKTSSGAWNTTDVIVFMKGGLPLHRV